MNDFFENMGTAFRVMFRLSGAIIGCLGAIIVVVGTGLLIFGCISVLLWWLWGGK